MVSTDLINIRKIQNHSYQIWFYDLRMDEKHSFKYQIILGGDVFSEIVFFLQINYFWSKLDKFYVIKFLLNMRSFITSKHII